MIKFLNRDLENNNKGEVITNTYDGKTVRPDSIGKNADGKIDLVHDHKHFMDATEEQVIYNDGQMRAEQDMIQTGDGKHVVTMSSDNANLNEIPPQPRPSGPLADGRIIYYTDPIEGRVTHSGSCSCSGICSYLWSRSSNRSNNRCWWYNIAAANANGSKASLLDCLKNGIEGALVGAACGAVLGPLGMGIPGIAIGAGAGDTLFLPDEVSKGINSFASNIGKYFDKINKDFGINDPMIKDGEILVSTLAKFGWGTVEGTSFIAKTTLDAAKLDLGFIGKKLNLIDENTYKELNDNFGSDVENWKKVPQGIVNSAKNAIINGPKLITDPNISVDEASDIGNDVLNTIFILKGSHDLVEGIGNKVGDLGKRVSSAIDDFKENSGPKPSMEQVETV